MKGTKTWLINFIFLTCDILVLLAIFRTSLFIRRVLIGPEVSWEAIIPLVRLGILFCIGTFLAQGLYPGYGLTAVKELEHIAKAITLAFFLLAAVLYLNKPFQRFPRSILISAWGVSLVALPLVHFGLRNLLSRTKWYGMPVLIFGHLPWAEQVAISLKQVRRLGWKPVNVLPLEQIGQTQEAEPVIQMAILALATNAPVKNLVHDLNQRFRRVLLLRQKDRFGSLWIEPRDLDGHLGLEFHYHLLVLRNRWLKRGIDLAASSVLLILLGPFLIFLAILIVLDSPGPVFFRQERLGRDFRRFQVLKFRTMVVGAEEKLRQLLDADPVARAQYEKFHKLENDPRITRLGKLLRKYSIDELPQIFNVLKGEMSLAGPRAYMPSELDEIGSYAPIILRVAPGMTGWWQVLGRHNTSFQKRLELDEYYISNWSLWMDAYIFLKTIQVVLSGSGA